MGNAESRKNNAVSPDSRDSRSLLRSDIFHDHKAINEHIKAINRVIQNPETQIGFLKIMMAEGILEYKLLQEVRIPLICSVKTSHKLTFVVAIFRNLCWSVM